MIRRLTFTPKASKCATAAAETARPGPCARWHASARSSHASDRRSPVARWLGHSMHPSFSVSMCSSSPGNSRSYRTTGSAGSSAFRPDRPRRASGRKTVTTLRPTIVAMRRMGMPQRRSCCVRAHSVPSRLVRVFAGRELRSSSPCAPRSSKRCRHLRAVRAPMPAASAAGRCVQQATGVLQRSIWHFLTAHSVGSSGKF